MARLSRYFGYASKVGGRSSAAPAVAGVSVLGLVAFSVLMLVAPAKADDANPAPQAHILKAHEHAHVHGEDDHAHGHHHEATPLSADAYKDAPSDVVLWGELARAMVVRKGSQSKATFLPSVLELDGKTLSIVGFVTPTGEAGKPSKQFLLSDHAFMCAECEPPTPTGLVEVNTKDFVLAQGGTATVRGQFQLVKDDPQGLIYRLNNAVVLKQSAE